jgi:hypothetical protein
MTKSKGTHDAITANGSDASAYMLLEGGSIAKSGSVNDDAMSTNMIQQYFKAIFYPSVIYI